LGNGSYTVNYSVTGPSPSITTVSGNATLTFTGGTGTFSIPAAQFSTFGTYDIAVTSISFTDGTCSQTPTNNTTIIIIENTTATLTSAAGTDAQSICINTPITDITYSIGVEATGANVTGLPNGVTGVYNSGVVTISGTPTAVTPGLFTYTVTPTGTPCVTPKQGSIAVQQAPPTTVTITGTNSVCSVETLAYSTPVVFGATYTWAVPPGWSINSGQGSATVNVTSGATGTSGDVTVTVSNLCGSGTGTLAVNFLDDIGYGGVPTANSLSTCIGVPPSQIIIGGAAPSGPNYQWQANSNGGGFTNIVGATAQDYTISSAFYNVAGTHVFRRVISSSTTACDGNSDEVTLTVISTGAITVTGGGQACISTTLNASGGAGGTIYYQGTTSNGTSTADPSTSVVISASGTYYFRAQTPGPEFCWGPQTAVTVTIITPPTATAVTICQGSTAQSLTATSACQNITTTSQTFNANGTFVAPANLISAVVEAWGGGGAGGTDPDNNGTAGGGGGAYASSHLTSATLTPGNYAVVVGAGGATAGTNGAASSFGATGPNFVQALGGGSNNASLTGGAGGSGPSSTGNFFKATGGTGGIGSGPTTGTGGGGGGSSANAAGDGTNGNTFSGTTGGAGGNSPGMVDPQGNGGKGGDNGVANAVAGTAPGGGGGGRGDGAGTGAAGAPGRVIVTYTFSVADTYSWFTAATGGTAVQVTSSTTFNPIGDPEVIASGGIYSNLANTNTPDTYPFWVACSSNPTCRTLVNYEIIARPQVEGFLDTPETICQGSGDFVQLVAQVSGVDAEPVEWTTNGTGSLTTTGPLTAEYLPNPAEYGVITFTATTNDPISPNPCGPATDNVTLTINRAASAQINAPTVICTNEFPINLVGTVFGTELTKEPGPLKHLIQTREYSVMLIHLRRRIHRALPRLRQAR
jgi:hypothetical protein